MMEWWVIFEVIIFLNYSLCRYMVSVIKMKFEMGKECSALLECFLFWLLLCGRLTVSFLPRENADDPRKRPSSEPSTFPTWKQA